MDQVSFIYGFTDELEKLAKAKAGTAKKVYRAVRGAAGAGAKEVGKAGWRGVKTALPYAIVGGVPLYFGAKALAEGFGRGVSDDPDRPLPYER